MTDAAEVFNPKEFLKSVKESVAACEDPLGSVAFSICKKNGITYAGSGCFTQVHAVAICMMVTEMCGLDIMTVAAAIKNVEKTMVPKGMCH